MDLVLTSEVSSVGEQHGGACITFVGVWERGTRITTGHAHSYRLRPIVLNEQHCPRHTTRYPNCLSYELLTPASLHPLSWLFLHSPLARSSPTPILTLSLATHSSHPTPPPLVIHPQRRSRPPFPPSGTTRFPTRTCPLRASSTRILAAFRASDSPECSRPMKGSSASDSRTKGREREGGARRDELEGEDGRARVDEGGLVEGEEKKVAEERRRSMIVPASQWGRWIFAM